MNVHHLELFYYVARFGGIMEAVRNIPYGIQQPAVSGQVIQLEESLGVTLFNRRPFALTPAGQELYEFIEPFFSNVDAVGEKLRGGATQLVRIGAPAVVLRSYIPDLFQSVRQKFPRIKLNLREGHQPQLERLLEQQEIDFAITLIESKSSGGIKSQKLLDVPIILLVRHDSKIKAADHFWNQDKINETLISLPAPEAIPRHFQEYLSRKKIDWPIGIEVSSLDLIEAYVNGGFGVGLSVHVPEKPFPKGLIALSLQEVNPVTVGALWQGKLNPLTSRLLEAAQQKARSLLAGNAKAAG